MATILRLRLISLLELAGQQSREVAFQCGFSLCRLRNKTLIRLDVSGAAFVCGNVRSYEGVTNSSALVRHMEGGTYVLSTRTS